MIITVGVLATTLFLPSGAAEKLPADSKWTLALEAARREKTFFYLRLEEA